MYPQKEIYSPNSAFPRPSGNAYLVFKVGEGGISRTNFTIYNKTNIRIWIRSLNTCRNDSNIAQINLDRDALGSLSGTQQPQYNWSFFDSRILPPGEHVIEVATVPTNSSCWLLTDVILVTPDINFRPTNDLPESGLFETTTRIQLGIN